MTDHYEIEMATVIVHSKPDYAIDSVEHYWILDNTIVHCGEQQYVHECKYCGETLECYYCDFDYSAKHDCEES